MNLLQVLGAAFVSAEPIRDADQRLFHLFLGKPAWRRGSRNVRLSCRPCCTDYDSV